jgi:acetate kinase
MSAVLEGLDVLIFTDDVGLRCPEVREAACRGMEWCGIIFDPVSNRQAGGNAIASINQAGGPVSVLVVPNDEEWVIGLEGMRFLK